MSFRGMETSMQDGVFYQIVSSENGFVRLILGTKRYNCSNRCA